ncbi:MAG: thiamine phosphate synthase [Pikeienuella sp.]
MGAAEAPRLYLVTPTEIAPEALARITETLLASGTVACVRLDLGAAEDAAWIAAANALLPIAHSAEVPLLATDRADLVVSLGLDGVHLTRPGSGIAALRKRLGKDRILGAFGGASRHMAMSLAEAGADYVALGPLHGDGAAEDALFAWWAEMIEIPCVAEGHATAEDAARLAETTDFIVPDPAIWTANDPASRLAAYAAALAG